MYFTVLFNSRQHNPREVEGGNTTKKVERKAALFTKRRQNKQHPDRVGRERGTPPRRNGETATPNMESRRCSTLVREETIRTTPRWKRGSALGRGAKPRASRARVESFARRTRINEAGGAVPGSQDSITRGVWNQQLADVPAAQLVPAGRVPATMPNTRRPTRLRRPHQRAFLQSAQCGADPLAHTGYADSGLIIGSRRGNRCNQCKADTATRDIYSSGYQSATTSRTPLHQLPVGLVTPR